MVSNCEHMQGWPLTTCQRNLGNVEMSGILYWREMARCQEKLGKSQLTSARGSECSWLALLDDVTDPRSQWNPQPCCDSSWLCDAWRQCFGRPASLTIGCCVGPVTLSDPLSSTTCQRTVLGVMSVSTSSRLFFVSRCYPSTAGDTDWAGNDDTDVDVLADQYSSVITSIADRLTLLKTVTCRRRASDPWFDDECCAARKFERWCSHLSSYREQWRSKLRSYRRLTRRKRAEFCHASVKEQSLSPRWLWRSIDHGPGDAGRVTTHQTSQPQISTSSSLTKFLACKRRPMLLAVQLFDSCRKTLAQPVQAGWRWGGDFADHVSA